MIREVARREIVTRGRSKTYRVTTGFLVAITVLVVALTAIFAGGDDEETVDIDVGVVPTGAVNVSELGDTLETIAPDGVLVTVSELTDESVSVSVGDGDVDVAIRNGDTLVWSDEPNPFVEALVAEALTRNAIDERAGDLGLDTDALGPLLAPVALQTELLDPPSDSSAARTTVATVGIFLMFFAIQMYGSQIALVVVEEKANRIIEILLALVRPRDLLAGKIAGVGVLAAAQMLIPIIGIVVALALSDFADVPLSAYASLPLLFVTFLLGFTMYGTMFAIVGSLVSRQEDAQQALFPVFVPIIAGYALALQAVAAPDSSIAKIASIVPFTSPFALPVTVAQGSASPALVGIALVLLAATTAAFLALGARIYEFTLLRTGSRIPLSEAIRLARR